MSENCLHNDRFPTDLRTLLFVCALLSLLLPTDRVQSFTGLATLAFTVPERRR
jgi:hypothetical protein